MSLLLTVNSFHRLFYSWLWRSKYHLFTYCVCVKRKKLCNCHSSLFFLFFFSFSSLFLDRLARVFLRRNYCLVIHDTCGQDWTCSFSFSPSRQDFGRTALSFLANVFMINYQGSVWPISDSFLGHAKKSFRKMFSSSCYS